MSFSPLDYDQGSPCAKGIIMTAEERREKGASPFRALAPGSQRRAAQARKMELTFQVAILTGSCSDTIGKL